MDLSNFKLLNLNLSNLTILNNYIFWQIFTRGSTHTNMYLQ